MEENIMSSEGRIRRSTFWTRWLIVFCCNVVLLIIQKASPDPVITLVIGIISLVLGIFMIIQTIKRMHDLDMSGWYSIVPIYNIVLAFTDGTPGPNRYGPDPKGRTTVCPSCGTHNEPELSICKSCGTILYVSPSVSPSVSSSTSGNSDTFLIIFIIIGVSTAFTNFLIQTLIPNWFEGLPRFITGGLNIIWGGSLILVGLAIKSDRYRIIGIVLASIWALYAVVRNISYFITDY